MAVNRYNTQALIGGPGTHRVGNANQLAQAMAARGVPISGAAPPMNSMQGMFGRPDPRMGAAAAQGNFNPRLDAPSQGMMGAMGNQQGQMAARQQAMAGNMAPSLPLQGLGGMLGGGQATLGAPNGMTAGGSSPYMSSGPMMGGMAPPINQMQGVLGASPAAQTPYGAMPAALGALNQAPRVAPPVAPPVAAVPAIPAPVAPAPGTVGGRSY